MSRVKSALVVFVAVFAAISCSKDKKEATTPNQANRPKVEETKVRPNVFGSQTDLEGVWETKCVYDTDKEIGRLDRYSFSRQVLAYEELKFEDPNCSQGQEIIWETHSVIEVVRIDEDGVMSHRIDFIQPSGAIIFQFVVAVFSDTAGGGRRFLKSDIEFLTSRNAGLHGDYFYKK